MPTIPIKFSVEGSADVTRVMGGMGATFKAVYDKMGQTASQTMAQVTNVHRRADQQIAQETRKRDSMVAKLMHEHAKAEFALTRAMLTGSKSREEAAKKEFEVRNQLFHALIRTESFTESEITNIARRHSREREGIARREAQERTRIERTAAREASQIERTAAQEVAGRRSTGRYIGNRLGGALRAGFGAASSFGQDIHGQIQDARRERAGTTNTLMETLAQTGDIRSLRGRMGELSSFSVTTGIPAQDAADALLNAQSQFSILGSTADYQRMAREGKTPEQITRIRNTRFGAALGDLREGRALGADPAEYLRLSGMVRDMGIGNADDPTDRTVPNLMRRFVAMGHSGSVDLQQISREVLSAARGRAELATASMPTSATPAERASAQQAALIQTVAETQQLTRAMGSPRLVSQNMLAMNRAMEGTRVGDKMRGNLEEYARTHTGDDALRARNTLGLLFEADPTRQNGAMRMRREYSGNALNIATAMSEKGWNSTDSFNLWGGGGRGDPQSLRQNWNATMSALMGRDGRGVAGYENVRSIQSANIDDATANDLKEVFESGPLAELNRNEERRLQALTNNSDRLVAMSTAFDNWAKSHPLEASAVNAARGAVGQVGGQLGGDLTTNVLGNVAAGPVGSVVKGAATAVAAIVGTSITTMVAGALAAATVGVGAGYALNKYAAGDDQGTDNYTGFFGAVSDFFGDSRSHDEIIAEQNLAERANRPSTRRMSRTSNEENRVTAVGVGQSLGFYEPYDPGGHGPTRPAAPAAAPAASAPLISAETAMAAARVLGGILGPFLTPDPMGAPGSPNNDGRGQPPTP